MKKEYLIFTLTALALFGMLIVTQALSGGSPTGSAASGGTAISHSAPLVIFGTLIFIVAIGYVVWKISRIQ